MSDYRQWCQGCGESIGFGGSHLPGCPSRFPQKEEDSPPNEVVILTPVEVLLTDKEMGRIRRAAESGQATTWDVKLAQAIPVEALPPRVGGKCRARKTTHKYLSPGVREILYVDEEVVMIRIEIHSTKGPKKYHSVHSLSAFRESFEVLS